MNTRSWHRSESEIKQMLALLVARAAMGGRPCPVAAKVLARMEAKAS
jgi:hypothetical protein